MSDSAFRIHHGNSKRTAGSADAENPELAPLQNEVERLLLITEALWRLLKEKHGLEDQELVRLITAIDMEDGHLDGRKPVSPPRTCAKCGRVVGKLRVRCLFCNEPVALEPFQR